MLTLYDEFSGAGGSTQGAASVPGVRPILAANHSARAIESHAANFPGVEHYLGDVVEADITRFPRTDIFWASPACPPWTDARGVKRDFDKTNQQVLFGEDGPDEHVARARALMEEIPRYLRHWAGKGRPVLGGVVENVIQCRKWDQWGRWVGEIKALGYQVRLIAFNSMHAKAGRTHRAPQSRDRLFLMYWLESLGRTPDLRKWLSPKAHCPTCDQVVDAVQSFKKPGNDMGRYRSQYVYRCPRHSCRGRVVEPGVLPAYVAIDWSLPGKRIGDRDEPLAPATIARIKAGIARYWVPLLTPAGGTWRNEATPVSAPMPARTTRENDAVAVPPLLVPVEGRPGKVASPADLPLRTQTARNETGLALPAFLASLRSGRARTSGVDEPMATIVANGSNHMLIEPFMVPLRGGGDKEHARSIGDPLATVTASGNHHGLAMPPEDGRFLLVPYNGKGNALPVTTPVGTFPTRDRWALASSGDTPVADPVCVDVDDVMFRMLEPHEIQRAMAFADGYIVLGNKRERVRQLGNAVTPPVAEVLVSALVEAITGEDLEAAA